MRRGIGLRGYAQQDPLNEFRREAFELYGELREPHPPPGRDDDLPGHRDPPAAARGGRPPAPPRRGRRAARRDRGPGRCRGGRPARPGGGAGDRDGPRPAERPAAGRGPVVGGLAVGPDGAAPLRESAATARPSSGEAKPGLHPVRRPDRPQRPVLVRLGPEVQEVPRPLTDGCRRRPEPVALRPTPPHPRVKRTLLGSSGAGSVGAVIVVGWTTWRIWDVGNHDDRRPADAIVVLGAAQYNGRPSAILKARLDHAIDLYEAGLAPYLVVTGGKAEGDRTTEAASARAVRPLEGRAGRRDPRRGPAAGRRSNRSAAVAAILRDRDARRRRCSCRTGPTCCASCGSPATRGSAPSARRRATSPTDATLENRRRGDAPRARRADPLLRQRPDALSRRPSARPRGAPAHADEPESRPKTARETSGFSLLARAGFRVRYSRQLPAPGIESGSRGRVARRAP